MQAATGYIFLLLQPKRAVSSLLGIIIGLGVLLETQGCAAPGKHYYQLEQQLARHNYQAADSIVEDNKAKYGARNAVLYDLDRAMTLHLAGRYAESNAFLFKAEARIDRLYTKSISAGVGAMLSNDLLLPYEGEDFEKVQLNLIAALNYAYLREGDEALVEARKVDLKLTAYNDRYATKNVYKEDAFARYLSGILYEAQGELNDAFIAYRKALEAYETYQEHYGTRFPPALPADLLRVTQALGLREEYETYRRRFPGVGYETIQALRGKGELVYISYNGFAPLKQSYAISVPVPASKGQPAYLLRVAFPRFVPRPSAIAYAKLRVSRGTQQYTTRTSTVQDLTAIARKNLEDRIGRIRVKALARAVAKYLAARALAEGTRRKTGNQTLGAIVGILANIVAVVTERADTRSWRTLPGTVQLARLSLPPGTYTVTAVYYATHGGVLAEHRFTTVRLKAGEKTFLGYRLLK